MVLELDGDIADVTPDSITIEMSSPLNIVTTASLEKLVIVKHLLTTLLDKSNYQAW